MKISEAFPSKYLKAVDLGGKTLTKRIAYCEMEKVGMNGDEKPVLHFVNEDRGLVLNKTNGNVLGDAWGDESESWRGRTIRLAPTRVPFQGKMTDSIRVEIPDTSQAPLEQYTEANPPPNLGDEFTL